MIILASEDIGLANPTALIMANATFQSVQIIGYPEARIILSQCALYLATSPKSNSSYIAINKAQQEVKQSGDLPVPMALRNAPTKLMEELGYGEAYAYAHDYAGNFSAMEFLPGEISGKTLYKPGQNSREAAISEFIKSRWKDKYDF
jgi:putative ATPase